MSVALRDVTKTYPARGRRAEPITALDEVDVGAGPGELLVIVGPSGSGKTTLLRCLAGLETVDAGLVFVDDHDVTHVPAGERDVAMVFQEYALFPHLSVARNIGFGLRARKTEPAETTRLVAEAAAMLGLDGVLERLPSELSGGERQRVALARALVRDPAVFLLDEPLSKLDAELRARTRADIRALQRRLGKTLVYVTHDQVEAMSMGDRVAVLRAGRVEQVDTPEVLYDSPANTFVARFIGAPPMNLLPSSVLENLRNGPTTGFRPERARVTAVTNGRVSGRVVENEVIGGDCIVHVEVGAAERVLVRAERPGPAVGTEVGLAIDDRDLYGFEEDGRACA